MFRGLIPRYSRDPRGWRGASASRGSAGSCFSVCLESRRRRGERSRRRQPRVVDPAMRGSIQRSPLLAAGAGALIFSKQTADLLGGIRRCVWSLGGLPQLLVCDRQIWAARASDGRPTEEFASLCGQLRVDWLFCTAGDPQAEGSSSACRTSWSVRAADRRRVGYIPFDPHAVHLMFMLVSRRHEHASLIVTSNSPSRRGARSSPTGSPPPR